MSTVETPAPRWQRVDDPGFWPAWNLARKRMDAEPQMLTEDDLDALALLDPAAAEHGRRLRAAAIEAGVPTPAPAKGGSMAATTRRAAAKRPHPWPDEQDVAEVLAGVLKPLVARIKALEERPELKYLGVWDEDRTYAAGSAVTHAGCIWIAKRATGQRPNEDGAAVRDWVLAVKRGHDGKDLR